MSHKFEHTWVDQYIRTASLISELLVSEGISAAASGKSLAGLSSISKCRVHKNRIYSR